MVRISSIILLGVLCIICLRLFHMHVVEPRARQGDDLPSEKGVADPQQTQGRHFRFTWAGHGRTMKTGAKDVSFSRYKAEDGVLVERFVELYISEREADQALSRLSNTAAMVVRTGNKVDASGERIGRRIELVLGGPQGNSRMVVAWQDGPRVFVLRSNSWDHVLDFEQQDYPAALAIPKS